MSSKTRMSLLCQDCKCLKVLFSWSVRISRLLWEAGRGYPEEALSHFLSQTLASSAAFLLLTLFPRLRP